MNAIKQTHRGQEGSVLLGVACFLFLAVGLVLTILSLGSNHRKVSVEQVNMEQAMYVAEGGLERGAGFMALPANLTAIVTSSTGNTNGSGSLGAGTYAFVITRSNATTYNLVATGIVNGVQRTVSLQRIYQPSYAEFSLWSQTNGPIYFVNGEVFNGQVHADDMLYFDVAGGGPVFHAAVTSNAGTYSIRNGSISAVTFDQGLLLNSPQGTMADANFTDSTKVNCLKDTASSAGLVLQGNTTITFNGGTLSIINTRAGWTTAHTYTPPAEGIIYVANATSGSALSGTVYFVGGKVTGRMSIVSEADMTIGGSITYTTDPRTTPSSTDALGLITKSDVWVGPSAPNDVEIDAAIMATGQSSTPGDSGSFSVVNYNSGLPRGDLTIYGGIVQKLRGPVGQTSGGVPSHGFTKNYSYDPRFINNPPPYYPTIQSEVKFSQWREGH
jgi:hypothetical protein